MIPDKSLVIYKNRLALVIERDDDKYTIAVPKKGSYKVREKDIEVLHPGPCTEEDWDTSGLRGNAREAWELMNDNAAGFTLKETAELIYGEWSPKAAVAAWGYLEEGLFFTGDINEVKARPASLVEAGEKKLEEKQREAAEREAFLERMRKAAGGQGETSLAETDRRFLSDAEALARGQTDKSRTLKELGKSETPQEAHRLLLAAGLWTVWENPYPHRFGFVPASAKIVPPPPPEEDRLDLSRLPAFAIDNDWSDDPDDAVSLEGPDEKGSYTLWVHVADPAASVTPDSAADIEARNRGATLYLPETCFRMLAPEILPVYALDYCKKGNLSPALSFKLALNKDCSIAETSVFISRVKVTRLTYAEADALVSSRAAAAESVILAKLFDLAERSLERRVNSGAVTIEMPEVHIRADKDEKRISVEPVVRRRSADMVRECMVLAGEGAARWALKNRIPFLYISQEEGEFPEGAPETGLAGEWQLRRCMRPRSVSVKPGVHWGLGLDEYAQVTSPIRRYTDLVCHQQIRAFLKHEPLLNEEEIALRIGIADAAANAAAKAERASRSHWLAVYLSGKTGSSLTYKGVVLDVRGRWATVLIPDLGLETQVNLKGGAELNETIDLILLSAKIPEAELVFASR